MTRTLTFLVTDIEGSTELWERFPEAMPEALARHDGLLRDTIEAHGGTVFKTVGDGIYGAFSAAPPAVAASLAGQRALVRETWPTASPIRVRMALHSGQAEERGGDYFGPAVNRVARILAAGHGGQILLTQAVERLVVDRFPEGAALRDLGARSLKDLTEPERIFQLVTDDLPVDFPPLDTLDIRPHNLPAQTTPLVGREEAVREVRELVRSERVRLVTLTGPGGTGKTRLGLQVAAEIIDRFRDGVFHVNLAPVQDPALLAATILRTLGIKPDGDEPEAEALRGALRDRELLLLLDNFEQILPAAPVVSDVLRSAAAVKMLVTSQAALRVQGEHEYPVPPLALPSPRETDPGRLSGNESVALFLQRAQASLPTFELTRDNAPAVASIVHQLDGLPLAIELAAARIKLFPPEAMVRRLARQFEFLTSGDRDRPDRHRTLRQAIQWSYDLLNDDERRVFERMSVFDGGFTLEAAEAVLVDEGETLDVLEALASLVDKSLLRQVQTAGDEPRFERLRTIRAYAGERLAATGETDRWRRRHAEHFAALAEAMDPSQAADRDARRGLERLGGEYENLRAAFEWALESGDGHLAVRLSRGLPALWFTRGLLAEGRRWLERILVRSESLTALDRAHALNLSGRLGQIQGDNSPAVLRTFEESLALYREAGHRPGIARALMNLGNARRREGDFAAARELFEESRVLYVELGDAVGIVGADMNLGDVDMAEGNMEAAAARFKAALELSRSSQNQVSQAFTLEYLGLVDLLGDRLDQAEAWFEESRSLFEVLGSKPGQAWIRYALGHVALRRGQVERARELQLEALERFEEIDYAPGLAGVLLGLACVELTDERAERAAVLLGAAGGLHGVAGIGVTPLEEESRRQAESSARRTLGDATYDGLREQGEALSVPQALAVARGGALPERSTRTRGMTSQRA